MTYRIVEKPSLHIVGIRIPIVGDMEENLRIVPKFWQSIVRGPLFARICALPAGEPKGILGISVYENPQNIYYYIGPLIPLHLPACMNITFLLLSGWCLKMRAALRKRYSASSGISIQNGCRFPDISTQNCPILRYILSKMEFRNMAIQKYGLQFVRRIIKNASFESGR